MGVKSQNAYRSRCGLGGCNRDHDIHLWHLLIKNCPSQENTKMAPISVVRKWFFWKLKVGVPRRGGRWSCFPLVEHRTTTISLSTPHSCQNRNNVASILYISIKVFKKPHTGKKERHKKKWATENATFRSVSLGTHRNASPCADGLLRLCGLTIHWLLPGAGRRKRLWGITTRVRTYLISAYHPTIDGGAVECWDYDQVLIVPTMCTTKESANFGRRFDARIVFSLWIPIPGWSYCSLRAS